MCFRSLTPALSFSGFLENGDSGYYSNESKNLLSPTLQIKYRQRIQKILPVSTRCCLKGLPHTVPKCRNCWCIALDLLLDNYWDMTKHCKYLRHKMSLKVEMESEFPGPFLFAVISRYPFTKFLVSYQLELTRDIFGIM